MALQPAGYDDLEPEPDRCPLDLGSGQMHAGSLGSKVWHWRFVPDQLDAVMAYDWNRHGSRVWIDSQEGIVSLMTLSILHATLSDRICDVVKQVALAYGDAAGSTRDASWYASGRHKGEAQADESFYLGETTRRFLATMELAARDDFGITNPPQLVVEVEVTSFDKQKPDFYRAVGASEMWRIDVKNEEAQVEILALQAPRGPRKAEESVSFPGLSPEIIVAALRLADAGRTNEIRDMIRRDARGMPEILVKFKRAHTEWMEVRNDPDLEPSAWILLDKMVVRGVEDGHDAAFEADPDYRAWLADPLTEARHAARAPSAAHSEHEDRSDDVLP